MARGCGRNLRRTDLVTSPCRDARARQPSPRSSCIRESPRQAPPLPSGGSRRRNTRSSGLRRGLERGAARLAQLADPLDQRAGKRRRLVLCRTAGEERLMERRLLQALRVAIEPLDMFHGDAAGNLSGALALVAEVDPA